MQLIERHFGSQSCSHLLNELMVMNLFQTTHQISRIQNRDTSLSFSIWQWLQIVATLFLLSSPGAETTHGRSVTLKVGRRLGKSRNLETKKKRILQKQLTIMWWIEQKIPTDEKRRLKTAALLCSSNVFGGEVLITGCSSLWACMLICVSISIW